MIDPSEFEEVEIGPDLSWAVHRWPGTDPRGITVVALHGYGGDGLDFALLADIVPGVREWICPDVLGHGDSSARDEVELYSMPSVVGQFQEVVRKAVRRNYLLLGYSMGGRIALSSLALGGQDWRRPKALVLVGATPGIGDADEADARRIRDAEIAHNIEHKGMLWFVDYWDKLPILQGHKRIEPVHLAAMNVRKLAQNPVGLARSMVGTGTGAMPSLWGRLGEVPEPTLLVTGGEDEKFTDIAEDMMGTMPGAEHEILEGLGHAPHLEDPQRFSDVLVAWARRQG